MEPRQKCKVDDGDDSNDADDDEDDGSGDDDECEYGESEGISDGGDVHTMVVTVMVTVTTRIMAKIG